LYFKIQQKIKFMKTRNSNYIAFFSVFVLLFATTQMATAQENDIGGAKGYYMGEVGARFMPTMSSFDMNTSSGGTVSGTITLGFGMGILAGFYFSDYVGVQGELLYSSITQTFREENGEHRINLRHVNIPLLLSLNTGKSKPVNLNVVLGPQIGFNVGSSISFTGTANNNEHGVLSVKKNDLGFAHGLGVDFGVNDDQTFRIGLGYRGVVGLVDISDNSQSLTTGNYYILERSKLRTHALYAGASFLF
jgi:hypothetical protein